MQFKRANRVSLVKDFEYAKKNSIKVDCGAFIFCICKNVSSQESRIGIVASKKVGNAVQRNYTKRVFREIFRANLEEISENIGACDIIIFARKAFNRFTYDKISEKFCWAISSDGVLKIHKVNV